jgi:hypothetical protein
MQLAARIAEFRRKHESKLEIAFFVGGFVFDAWMVSAPDELFAILQQAAYLFFIASLIHFELLFRLHKWRPGDFLLKAWPYRNLVLHFLLGTLLNIYSIFYIKSASLLNSFIFLILMIGMILGNELPFVKKSNVSLKVGLYSICLFSYFSILFPIIFGYVGYVPFGCAVASTLALFYLQLRLLRRALLDQKVIFRAILAPCMSVLFVFVLFYFLGWIPPVPLSVKEQGVYHLVEKRDGVFYLSTEKKWWKFWQQGDSEFQAEPEDKIYFYAQIYSPARISDQVVIHWFEENAKGNWISSDTIPLKIQGGREQGYRGFAFKSNYAPGKWKIIVETSTGIEISRMYFDVIPRPPGEPRNFVVLTR